MLDLLARERTKLAQAETNFAVSRGHLARRLTAAKNKTHSFICSPVGLLSIFGAGIVKGAIDPKPPSIRRIIATKLAQKAIEQ
jgi:hypothetical protein